MGVNSVSGATQTKDSSATNQTSVLGMQDQFMQILLTQLRYQDPMEPMNEKDFFAQMAQFTSATEMSNLNTKMDSLLSSIGQLQVNNKLLAAANLVGTRFTAYVDGKVQEGIVESAVLLDGNVYVKSGEWLVPVDSLIEVGVVPDAG